MRALFPSMKSNRHPGLTPSLPNLAQATISPPNSALPRGFTRLGLPCDSNSRLSRQPVKIQIPFLLFTASAAALLFAPRSSMGADKAPHTINSSDKKAIAAKIGKEVSVEGFVQSPGRGDSDGVRFLNLSAKPQTGFVAAIFPPAYKKVGPSRIMMAKMCASPALLKNTTSSPGSRCPRLPRLKCWPIVRRNPPEKS